MSNVVWCPHLREPPRISAWTLYFQKLELLAYIFVADSSGLQKLSEYISNSLSFPLVFQSYKIPWDFQVIRVFQTCKQPVPVHRLLYTDWLHIPPSPRQRSLLCKYCMAKCKQVHQEEFSMWEVSSSWYRPEYRSLPRLNMLCFQLNLGHGPTL